MSPDRVVVAEILRPRGNRGEVLIKSLSDVPGRFEQLKRALARLADGRDVPIEVADAWVHDGAWVLKLGGVDSLSAAERFRGAEIWVPPQERGRLPEGEFFASDLIGCAVTDAATGSELGRLEDWRQCGGPPLMQVIINGREVLIPFVPAICREIDLTARTIRVELPQGLLDL